MTDRDPGAASVTGTAPTGADEPGLRQYDPDKPVSLAGLRCAYCGTPIAGRQVTRDHVVARRFVPEGAIGNGFNLQVPACRPCNDRKARLEDDISLITMLPDTAGRYARDDDRLRRSVARKSRGCLSPVTRRLAAQSYNSIRHRVPMGGNASLTWEGVAMPTIEERRIAELAWYQVQGFCYFRSYEPTARTGAWLGRDRFLMLGQAIDADWGNPQLRHFVTETRAWETVCVMNFADGYFRHAMFRRPGEDIWAWALEWNARLRVYGIYGGELQREAFLAAMPALHADFSYGDTTNGFAMRVDTPLGEDEDDLLFAPPDGFEEGSPAAPHWRRSAPSSDPA